MGFLLYRALYTQKKPPEKKNQDGWRGVLLTCTEVEMKFSFSLYLVKEFVATGGILKSLAGVVQSVTELG